MQNRPKNPGPKYESIQFGDGNSFRALFYRWHSLEGHLGWHLHPELEITYLINGHGMLFVGDSITHVREGDLFLLGPDPPHSWREEDHPDEDHEIILVQFPIQVISNALLGFPEAKALTSLLDRAKRGLLFSLDADSPVVEQLWDTVKQHGLTRLTALYRMLDSLSASAGLPLVSESYRPDSAEFNSERMNRIVNYVKDNLDQEIVQSNIARELGMKPASFSRFFRNTTGRTFVSFVNQLRTSEACRMLAFTEDDITRIAFAVGYSNISNFNRHFRDIRGMTPSEYRKLQKNALVPA